MPRLIINTSGGRSRGGFTKSRFIELDDTPPSYDGASAFQNIIVNEGKTGVEFGRIFDLETGLIITSYTANGPLVMSGGTGTMIVDTPIISRGATHVNPDGITAGINLIAWYAPFACTVITVKGYRVGGTGATINARKNGTSDHLSSALSLTSADTWMDGGEVQNATYAAGDKLEIMIVTVAGDPTQIAVQVDFNRIYS